MYGYALLCDETMRQACDPADRFTFAMKPGGARA
ncbi:MAG: hypothetical protein RLZZ598_598 [Pseudomonadota bacterium]|jgi:hypothetical protein